MLLIITVWSLIILPHVFNLWLKPTTCPGGWKCWGGHWWISREQLVQQRASTQKQAKISLSLYSWNSELKKREYYSSKRTTPDNSLGKGDYRNKSIGLKHFCTFIEESCVVLVIRTVFALYCIYFVVTWYTIFTLSICCFIFPYLDILSSFAYLNALSL